MFVLCSDITIGKFHFSGAHEVNIKRSLHSIADTATIKLPSVAKVVTNGKVMPDFVITGKQFSDGDPVNIRLGYNGNYETEFEGFVKSRDLNMPLEITCEGYSWLLRRNNVNQFQASINVKELLEAAVSGIDKRYKIEVQCDVVMQLSNVQFNNKSGFDVISELSKYTDGCLTCFFIQPSVLWCGFVYSTFAKGTNVLGASIVQYRLGYNTIKSNYLKERIVDDNPVQVKYFKRLANGGKISASPDVFNDATTFHSKILNHIGDATYLQQLAEEKAYKMNYEGYEGTLQAFLLPNAWPGYAAYITDARYPELNGNYLIESTEVSFGINGARRILETGPLSGFANNL